MTQLVQDVRHGARLMRHNPGFTVVAISTLALGIGASTAIFSVVDGVLLRPLPYADDARLVLLNERSPNLEQMSVAWPNFLDWRDQSRTLEQFAAYRFDGFTLTGTDEPERLLGRACTAAYLRTLGIDPILGRHLAEQEDAAGAAPVVLLSEGLWQRRFGADPAAVGRAAILEGVPHTIVGVVPDALARFQGTDVYVPLQPRLPPNAASRGVHPGLTVVARLQEGTTLDEARAEMRSIAAGLAQQYPDSSKDNTVNLYSVRERFLGSVRPALSTAMWAVGVVLLIACANVANLMLARAGLREGELAIRAAMGARRARLLRQLLTESLLIALAGGALGIVLAFWGVDLLLATGGSGLPRVDEVSVNGGVLVFSLLLSVTTGLLFGIVPALRSSRPDLNRSLKEGGRGSAGGPRTRVRSVLVTAEIALTLVLLVAAGLLARSFQRLHQVEAGFDAGGVLTFAVSLPQSSYATLEAWTAFHDRAIESIGALPGVGTLSAASSIPMEGPNSESSCAAEGRIPAPGEQGNLCQFVTVSSGYFRALRIPLLRGRDFELRDSGTSVPVVIVDASLAEGFWPGEDAVGRRLAFEGTREQPHWREVVGVVGTTRHYGPEEPTRPQVYIPYHQIPEGQRDQRPGMFFFVRPDGPARTVAPSVRAAIWAMDATLPIDARSLADSVDGRMAQRRFAAMLTLVFSAMALLLASIGIYGVISYSVARRTHELGIRIALGARERDVVMMVIRHGLALTVAGISVGLPIALGTGGFVRGMLFGVTSIDPFAYIAAPLVICAAALLACWVPVRRATKVDPMVALRYE